VSAQPPPPTLAELHRQALARFGGTPKAPRRVHVRVDFDGSRYMAAAVRTTAHGTGAEECAASVDHPTAPDALRGLAERLSGEGGA